MFLEKRKNNNKNEIVDAAERLFFSKGYDNSAMDEIAKEAGYTKRTLYSYFTSKEEIYEKIATEMNLSESIKTELTLEGNFIYRDRINWAKTHLKHEKSISNFSVSTHDEYFICTG